jgi:DNA topoisomerase-3
VEHGQTKVIKGFKTKTGTIYDAKLILSAEFKVVVEGSSGAAGAQGDGAALGPCPKCKEGTVRPTPKGAGCSRWREGCIFNVWREQYGKELTDEHMRDLVLKGRTELIKEFKKKSGTGTYDARLVLNEEFKARLEFDNSGGGGVAPSGSSTTSPSPTATPAS